MTRHTHGTLAWTESQYDPDRYTIGINGRWLMSIQHNGEQLVEQQRENMRRLVACWNANQGIETDAISGTFQHRHPEPVFVYRSKEGSEIRAEYMEQARQMGPDPAWEHVATLEPRAWMQTHYATVNPVKATHHTIWGRSFKIVAEYPDTTEGKDLANGFMERNPNAALLAKKDGRLILADTTDKGEPA